MPAKTIEEIANQNMSYDDIRLAMFLMGSLTDFDAYCMKYHKSAHNALSNFCKQKVQIDQFFEVDFQNLLNNYFIYKRDKQYFTNRISTVKFFLFNVIIKYFRQGDFSILVDDFNQINHTNFSINESSKLEISVAEFLEIFDENDEIDKRLILSLTNLVRDSKKSFFQRSHARSDHQAQDLMNEFANTPEELAIICYFVTGKSIDDIGSSTLSYKTNLLKFVDYLNRHKLINEFNQIFLKYMVLCKPENLHYFGVDSGEFVWTWNGKTVKFEKFVKIYNYFSENVSEYIRFLTYMESQLNQNLVGEYKTGTTDPKKLLDFVLFLERRNIKFFDLIQVN